MVLVCVSLRACKLTRARGSEGEERACRHKVLPEVSRGEFALVIEYKE